MTMVGRRGAALVLAVISALLAGCAAAPQPSAERPAETQVVVPATTRGIPAAPIAARTANAAGWTGQEMIIWGGLGVRPDGAPHDLGDGAAYDPATDAWRVLAAAPLAPRTSMATVWTGDRLFVWGGAPRAGGGTPFADGALYDPATDTWESLPPAPIGGRTRAAAVWTGTEVLLWGGNAGGGERLEPDGAAYEPSSGQWRRIPAAVLPRFYEFGSVWTGTELVVLAGAFPPNDGIPIGRAYAPATDVWRDLPAPPLGQGYGLELGWDGAEVVATSPVPEPAEDAVDDPTTSAAYDPVADTWRRLPRPGGQPNWATMIQADDAIIFWDASPRPGIVYLVDQEAWAELPAVEGPHREFPSLVWTGTEVLAWGGNDNCEADLQGGAADCNLELLADGVALRLNLRAAGEMP